MGLFDSLPPPSAGKGADKDKGPAKRLLADAATPPLADAKKARLDDGSISRGDSQQRAPLLPCTPIAAAYSEDKGSRLTMEDIAVIDLEAGRLAASPSGGSSAAARVRAGAAAAGTAAGHPSGVRLSFLAIFDGHGGTQVARYAADHLHASVMKAGMAAEVQRLDAAPAAAQAQQQPRAEQHAQGEQQQQQGEKNQQQQQPLPPPLQQPTSQRLPQPSVKQCKAAITEGFKELDKRVMEQCSSAGWADGCTAVALWVLGDTALVANVGDARCVLARRLLPATQQKQQAAPAVGQQAVEAAAVGPQQAASGNELQPPQQQGALQPAQQIPGQQQQQQQQQQRQQTQQEQQGEGLQPTSLEPLKAVTLTREHKAIFPAERQRIEQAGSFVSGDGRLAGRIEVSRAFGDKQFKRAGMSAVPDVQAFQMSGRDAFLLLACDGFWGVFSPQDAVDFAQRELRVKGNSVKQTCNRLIHEAIRERRCKDNCTVMLVELQHGQAAGSSSGEGR